MQPSQGAGGSSQLFSIACTSRRRCLASCTPALSRHTLFRCWRRAVLLFSPPCAAAAWRRTRRRLRRATAPAGRPVPLAHPANAIANTLTTAIRITGLLVSSVANDGAAAAERTSAPQVAPRMLSPKSQAFCDAAAARERSMCTAASQPRWLTEFRRAAFGDVGQRRRGCRFGSFRGYALATAFRLCSKCRRESGTCFGVGLQGTRFGGWGGVPFRPWTSGTLRSSRGASAKLTSLACWTVEGSGNADGIRSWGCGHGACWSRDVCR